jgi:hypothetical protein
MVIDPLTISARRISARTIELLPDPLGPANAVSIADSAVKLT